jgi:argininosuccinate lyase
VNKSPLGCGALAGNAFSIDRVAMAKELGFDSLIHNSMAAVGDRDFALEAMQWGSTLMLHISRWSEDLIIYASTEFGFVRLADAYTTGSSLMPQKRNCSFPIMTRACRIRTDIMYRRLVGTPPWQIRQSVWPNGRPHDDYQRDPINVQQRLARKRRAIT